MERYELTGVVVPERVPLQQPIKFETTFKQVASDVEIRASVNIESNKITVQVELDQEYNVYDLRNCIHDLVHRNISVIGYLTGRAHDVDIVRIVNSARGLDHIYGNEPSGVEPRAKGADVVSTMHSWVAHMVGEAGLQLQRALDDLHSALDAANDTAFYCSRALETLTLHCAMVHHISLGESGKDKLARWVKFNSVAQTSKDELAAI